MHIRTPGLHTVRRKLANGTTRVHHYAWRGEPAIKEPYGTPAFAAELARLIAERDTGHSSDTVAFMIDKFLTSPEGMRGAKSTLSERRRYAEIIKKEYGELPLIALSSSKIKTDLYDWRDRHAHTPRKADEQWAQFRRIVGWGVKRGMVETNPLSGYDSLYESNRANMIWRQPDVQRLLSHCNPSMQRVYRGTIHLGARMKDLVGMTWTCVQTSETVWRTSKGQKQSRTARVPHTPAFRALLSDIPRTSTHIFTNESGRPFSMTGLKSNDYRARKRANLLDLHYHDLRGTKATALAAQNISNIKIAGQLGWSKKEVDSMLERYVSFNALEENWDWVAQGL